MMNSLLQGLPERKMAEFTNPESPNFALKERKMEWDSKKVHVCSVYCSVGVCDTSVNVT